MDLRVKVVIWVLSPSFDNSPATAATVMLYWNPGVRPPMVNVVSLVGLLVLAVSSFAVQVNMYEVTLPSGLSQIRDTDEVVTLLMLRFLIAAGSRNTGKVQ